MSDGPPDGSDQPGWGPPPGPPPPSPPGWGQQPPPPSGYPQAPATDGTAIAALVLAIVSFVACPVVPAIVALVIARKAKENIARSNGALTGESLVQVATIVSWINLGLAAVGVVLVVILVAVGASTDSNDALAALLTVPA